MADLKISALTAATTPLGGTEVFPIVQSSTTVKASIANVQAAPVAAGTANAVQYLNGSKVPTTGTSLAFDGTYALGVGTTLSAWGGNYRAVQAGSTAVFAGNTAGNRNYASSNVYWDGSNYKYITTSFATQLEQSDGAFYWLQAASGTAGNNISFTIGMVLDTSGNLLVGTSNNSSSARIMCNGTFAIQSNGNGNRAVLAVLVSNENFNGAGTAIYVGRDGATSRSINAGGTVNASGADYAEYMTKSGDFTVAKGDVVGIDAQGKLTNVFANAISFVVKSTDPSYVGGDTWGNEETLGLKKPDAPVRVSDETEQRLVSEATEDQEAVYETIVTKAGDSDEEWATKEAAYLVEKAVFDAALESARAMVDRVAFAGQVPVNVLGATAGQYIVPVDDNGSIKGQAVSNPTFEQYQSAVGKVIAIEVDGRARIIVKVA
jgi:hypothetical protein